MKLLVDQNLPPKLAKVASTEFPGSCHVIDLQFDAEDDQEIWELAKTEGFVVISKDSDFLHRSLTYGAPPKVIHIDRGNCSTAECIALFFDHLPEIKNFVDDAESSLLVIG